MLIIICALTFGGCSSPKQSDKKPVGDAISSADKGYQMDENAPEGLSFSLRELGEVPDELIAPRLVEGEQLSAKETESLLARLPDLPSDAAKKSDFALRKRSRPAPRTGDTIEAEFPPEDDILGAKAPKTEPSGPLEVLRYAPEGEPGIAPKLSVTFSQPVVALQSQSDAARHVPAKIEPEVPGSWRWVGSQTALFEPTGERFPMATDYKIQVDPELKSATGKTIKNPADWTFSLPAPTITQAYPTNIAGASSSNISPGGNLGYTSAPQPLRPKIFIAFDQRISPEAMIEFIELKTGFVSGASVQLLSDEQIAADKTLKQLVERTPAGQWLAFEPDSDLPTATKIEVRVKSGAPSAEGDKTTPRAQRFSFKTYEPLRINAPGMCNEHNPCQPGQGMYLSANNPLDEDAFDPALITVEPALPGMEIIPQYQGINIHGRSEPRTVYTVTIQPGIKDTFGQKLQEPVTFKMHIGGAHPMLGSSNDLMTVLDPALKGKFPIYSVNFDEVRVVASRVQPADWPKYRAFLRDRARTRDAKLPGKTILDKKVALNAEQDQMTYTSIDLTDALKGDAHGHVIVQIEPTEPRDLIKDYQRDYSPILHWVQLTDLALDAFVTDSELLGWASNLADGAPLKDVELSLLHGESKSQSDAQGLATLSLPGDNTSDATTKNEGNILIARRGKDSAFLPEKTHYWDSGQSNWVRQARSSSILWHVFDDRGMYRPGETAHIKGWLREQKPTPKSNLSRAKKTTLLYEIRDSRGNKFGEGNATVDSAGSFDFKVDFPDDVNLGRAVITLKANADGVAGGMAHTLQVQEFRRPEFEVKMTNSEGPHLVNERSELTLHADYYAGGGLAGAPANWTVSASEGRYTPPGQSEFIFGRYSPWWWWMPMPHASSPSENFSGYTDASGEHRMEVSFENARPALPHTLRVNGSVRDVNRQTWSASRELLVHPSTAYVGIRTEKSFIGEDDTLKVEAIVTDIDGEILTDRPVEIRATRLVGRWRNGQYKEEEREVETCEFRSAGEAQSCELKPGSGGSWRITATTRDEQGRPNMTQIPLWVAGGEVPVERQAEQLQVHLIPEKESYEAGDRAKILIQAPFDDAEALLSVRKQGIVSRERFKISGTTHIYELALSEDDYPGVTLQVDLVGSAPRADDSLQKSNKQPAFARGSIHLKLPPARRALDVKVSPNHATAAPGDPAAIDLLVSDIDGAAMPDATVAVVAVDEAILALSGYQIQDPLLSFYPEQPEAVRDYYLRQYLVLATLADFEEDGVSARGAMEESADMMERSSMADGASGRAMPAPQAKMMRESAANFALGGAQQASAAPAPIALREDFRALALFAPAVKTDAQGKARVDFKLPDNLTRYRLMAVASAGDTHFGTGESTLTARLPLMVRPSPPRFLNFGDRMQMPIVVQNQTENPMTVDLAVRGANLNFGDTNGKRVDVPANDRVEVRFGATTDEAGSAVVQVASASKDLADASTHTFPVWTPATSEAFATYGTLDDDGAQLRQPIKAPSDSFSQFGGVQITTSSTALQSLTDALIYLVDYPFSCSEQVASRIMGVGALRDVLQAFDSPNLPGEFELMEAMQRDIRLLSTLQRTDGGFYLWSDRDHFRYPYVEIHVTHGLYRAKQAGFEVPGTVLERATAHIREIERFIGPEYSPAAKNAIIAYSYYVLDLMGEPVQKPARALVEKTLAAKKDGANKQADELSMEAVGWLLSVLSDDKDSTTQLAALRQFAQNRVDETAATAQFSTDYGGAAHLLMHSSRRTDAIMLDAWMADQPKSDLIAKLVRGLLDHKTRGRWLNTQENAFILLALERYFKTYEAQTPDFVTNIWLGEGFAGAHNFKGREVDYQNTSIPMQTLVDTVEDSAGKAGSEKDSSKNDQQVELLVQKTGKGRLYYRLGMEYAPKSLNLAPFEAGFSVERTYEGVDDPDDVTQLDDGSWQVKAGSRVRVNLSMVAPARRYHVALVDPLPAGLEPLNPALAITEALPDADKDDPYARPYWWWFRPWYSHENLRDERAEAFAPIVYAGVFDYNYVTRATTPGEFIVPPAKAEEMYHPETFGRSGTARMIIK